jgi:hypothetical protein
MVSLGGVSQQEQCNMGPWFGSRIQQACREARALGGGLCGTESTQRRSYNPLGEKVETVSSTLGRITPHGTLLFM